MATKKNAQLQEPREGAGRPAKRARGATPATADLLAQYGCGPVQFSGTSDALYERHLLFGAFAALRDALLTAGDHYMHLADLASYLEADSRLEQLYTDPKGWARKAVLNVAASGKFSSDRTVAEYATEIWDAKPCPVP
jgi:hypothetical protein